MKIYTGCWFRAIPEEFIRVGISRGTPRGLKAGYRMFRALAPGPYFRSVSPQEYITKFSEQLKLLDPQLVVAQIEQICDGRTPVLCCYESAPKIHIGEQWCHRHLVAAFLEKHLGILVPEIDFEGTDFDRFAALRREGIDALSSIP